MIDEALHLQKIAPIYRKLYGATLILYGPYWQQKSGRRNVVVYDPSNQKTKSVAYAKVKLECFLGRKLHPGMHADHKDENPSNDAIENLEELEAVANKTKSNKKRTQPKPRYICPACGKEFERYAYKVTTLTPACSRSCGAIVGSQKRFSTGQAP